jgi:hypothetical protein
MKKINRLLTLLVSSFMLIVSQNALSTEDFAHKYCERIGDFRHHHSSGTACLRYNTEISKKDLFHFISHHLGNDIYKLDMSDQKYLDRSVLGELANSENASAIRYLNLMSTSACYCGIVELWKSSTFGSLVSDSPTYEQYTGTPISIIEIEIGHTKLHKQYKKRLFAYPLPLLKDFDITFGHRCIGTPWQSTGYKQIKLLDHGKELEKITKRNK